MPHDAELDAALDAARQAGLKLKTLYEDFKAIPNAPADISTEADRQSQEIVLKLLRAKFPGDAFCAEEETASLAGGPRVGPRLWIGDSVGGAGGFGREERGVSGVSRC